MAHVITKGQSLKSKDKVNIGLKDDRKDLFIELKQDFRLLQQRNAYDLDIKNYPVYGDLLIKLLIYCIYIAEYTFTASAGK